MPALTAKQLRAGSPADQLPFLVVRLYGEPKLYGKPSDVKAALLKDVADLRTMLSGGGLRTIDPVDAAVLDGIETTVTTQIGPEPILPLVIDVVVDSYTGTRYRVTVTDRRMP